VSAACAGERLQPGTHPTLLSKDFPDPKLHQNCYEFAKRNGFELLDALAHHFEKTNAASFLKG
jgi:hypothetical protein